ncbi:hypothetical protein RHGRI_010665 [Rhododendron griersonianum]|uniref:DUF632 domain-containing protein n=1 Tax=Rhododendron griersonianum TaxID=479676 RepID=A0AAV6KJI9_9ERIC|nr:hypothetical protein RHGRI_010665 [Rhododendron griersonianum]
MPPPPPPPPNFSLDMRKDKGKQRVEVAQEEIIEIDEDNSCMPPPPLASSTWDFWDPFAPSSPHCEKKSEIEEPIEEENWAETKSQFEEEEQEGFVGNNSVNMLPEKPLNVELLDDNSSMVSWHTKDTASADMAMVVWRRKKTLAGIVKELDDYFLKASDGGKDIVILMDINSSDTFLRQNPKEMTLITFLVKDIADGSLNISSIHIYRHLVALPIQLNAPEFCGPSEPCRPGAHSITLEKLYAEDQRLYKDIKANEYVENNLRVPPSSESYIPAVTSWYNSFHRLVKSQGEYVRAICKWIKLTYCFVEDSQWSVSSSAVHTLCEEWQLALDRLPDKVASEAIKSFLSAIQSIVLQQEEELTLRKKTDKLEQKLQRELNSLSEMEMKLEGNFNLEDGNSLLTPKHPLTLKHAKVEVLKKRVNEEKAKYLNSIRVTRAMTLNNLRTSLPHVFQALMGFSSAYAQSLEAILSRPEPVGCDAEFSSIR